MQQQLKNSGYLEIRFSKVRLVFLLTGALLFVLLGLIFILEPSRFANSSYRPKPVFMIFSAGLASFVFFGVCASNIIKKLFDKKPALIIDEHGITINTGLSAYICWDEIKGIGIQEIKRTKVIIIYLKKPDKFIKNQPGLINRRMLSLGYRMSGSPISITTRGLKCNFDKLYSILSKRINKSCASPSSDQAT